jgi:hypothetical protein
LTEANAGPHLDPTGIFGVPLQESIRYANVAISLLDDSNQPYIYGYVPIVVAKCGVYLKEKGGIDVVHLDSYTTDSAYSD